MVSTRTARIYRLHESLGVVLPIDWMRGMGIGKGDLVKITYNGKVVIQPLKDNAASADGSVNPIGPTQRPVQPAGTDEKGLADGGG